MKTKMKISKKWMAVAMTAVLFTAAAPAFSQSGVAINGSGAAAHASAMLDVASVTKGFLAPRMTAAQRTAIASPAAGLMVYQTDGTAGYYYYDGSAWSKLSTTVGTVTGVTASAPLSSSGGAAPDISLSGVVPIANGGTNTTATPTNGGVTYGTGTAQAYTAAGTTGQFLKSNGTSAPAFVNPVTGYCIYGTSGTVTLPTAFTFFTLNGFSTAVPFADLPPYTQFRMTGQIGANVAGPTAYVGLLINGIAVWTTYPGTASTTFVTFDSGWLPFTNPNTLAPVQLMLASSSTTLAIKYGSMQVYFK